MGKIIKNQKNILFLLIILGTLAVSSPVLAMLVRWPPSPVPGGVGEINAETELHELIAYIYEWAITLGGLAIFIILIYAGMEYLTSAGKPETMRSAQNRIKSGVIGLILLLSIWLVLNTINPALTQLDELELDLTSFLVCEIATTTDVCNVSADCEANHGPYSECDGGFCVFDQCKQRFGEYYDCEGTGDDARCVLDEEAWLAGFRPKTCASITVWPEGGTDEEGAPTGGYRRWERILLPGDRFLIGGKVWSTPHLYLNKHGEGFYAKVEFPIDPDRMDPETGNPKLYENCVAHIELYKGTGALHKCSSTRERVTVTATKHPDDKGNEICNTDDDCQIKFGKEYACDGNVCAWIQPYFPDQLYDEYVRCMEYRKIRMPF